MKAIHKTAVSAATLALMLSGPLAVARTNSSNPAGQIEPSAATTASTRPDAKPIEDLLLAAQRLRDAVHDMVNEPAGPKRSEMIKGGDRALADVESAMANLPPDMLTAQATESTYKQSADQLRRATENLRQAAQALATDPTSTRRNEAIRKIRIALAETHQLMHEIPRGSEGR